MPDPYFSPNGDGVKDTLAFNVIAETSEAYQVAIKRNGVAVKTWAGLTGSQSLSWDGLQNGQALADGSYRIVAMTEKQRDRVRDAQRVVLDNTAPEVKKAKIRKKNGKYELNLNITESGSGVAPETFVLNFKGGNASSFAGTSVFNSDKKLFTYTFSSATFEDIRSLSNGQVSALLNLGDKVGNHILNRKVPLSDSVCIGTGIETNSIEVDEADFSITYKGTVFGIFDSFDPNTISVDYGAKMSLSGQQLINFSRTNHPEGCQTGDFEIKASDVKMNLSENLPDLNIEETSIRAEFTEIEPSELIFMANNFIGFGIANVGPIRINEKIQCKTSQLLCQTDLVKEYNSKLPKFKKDLNKIYQTYYLPNVSDWLESEWPALYLDNIPVPKQLEITTYSGVHVSSSKGFGTKAAAVAPGMVQLALPLVARAILLDLGIKASAINPVVGGSVIVVTLTLPVAIDLMNRVAAHANQQNLRDNMPAPTGWLVGRPLNAHHIITEKHKVHADIRRQVFLRKM